MNLSQEITLLFNGELIPVTNLFDEFGNDVDSWNKAHTFVAGPLADGSWLGEECSEYLASKSQ